MNKHVLPSAIALQLGNGEAEYEKFRAYRSTFHIDLLFMSTEVRTYPKAMGLQRFEIFSVDKWYDAPAKPVY